MLQIQASWTLERPMAISGHLPCDYMPALVRNATIKWAFIMLTQGHCDILFPGATTALKQIEM